MMPLGSSPDVTGEWECMECGYVEEGAETRRPTKCPECGAPATALEFFSYGDEEQDWDSDEDEVEDDLDEDELDEEDWEDEDDE